MIVQLSVNTSDVIADEFLHKIHERVMREDGLVIAAGDETASLSNVFPEEPIIFDTLYDYVNDNTYGPSLQSCMRKEAQPSLIRQQPVSAQPFQLSPLLNLTVLQTPLRRISKRRKKK